MLGRSLRLGDYAKINEAIHEILHSQRYWPATANALNTTIAVTEAFHAILRRRCASAPAVTARKVGKAANGSTRKKMELNASTENRTYAEVFSPARVTE